MRTKKNIKRRKKLRTKKQTGGNPASILQKYLLEDPSTINESLQRNDAQLIIIHKTLKDHEGKEEIYLGLQNPEKRKIRDNIKGYIDSNIRITLNDKGIKTTFVLREKFEKQNSFFILKDYQNNKYEEFNTLNDFTKYLVPYTYDVVKNPELRVLESHGSNSQRWSI